MSEEIQSGLISRRRAVSLISVAHPASILVASKCEAQTAGMERREDRRENRQDRRDDRVDRREERRGGVVGQPATTGSAATTAPK
jgi:hypothetical protein